MTNNQKYDIIKEEKGRNMVKNILQDKDLRGGSYKWANWMSKLSLVTCEPCWENHGKIEDISITDNFFDIGGDSLKAIEFVSKAHSEYNLILYNHNFEHFYKFLQP